MSNVKKFIIKNFTNKNLQMKINISFIVKIFTKILLIISQKHC